MKTIIDTDEVDGVFVVRQQDDLGRAIDQACDVLEQIGDLVDRVRDAREQIRERARRRRASRRVLEAEKI